MSPRRRYPPLITSSVAKQILEGKGRISLDLGLTLESVQLLKEVAILPDGAAVNIDDLKKIEDRENAIFSPDGRSLRMVAVSDGHFYKLVPTGGAPTLEVNGVRMHRTKDTSPEVDATDKIETLGIRDGDVLDTCTGLGYTAQAAAERGADLVVSVELRPQVIRLAEVNPWSRRLFEDHRIHMMIGDSSIIVGSLPQGYFDYAVHDPPRFAHAGQLYSLDFYREVFEALRGGGRLFHYTGEPGSRHRGIDLRKGVMRRLGEAGFTKVEYHEEVFGVTSMKPLR